MQSVASARRRTIDGVVGVGSQILIAFKPMNLNSNFGSNVDFCSSFPLLHCSFELRRARFSNCFFRTIFGSVSSATESFDVNKQCAGQQKSNS